MLSDEEIAELRDLQRRAYGPGGGLPAQDAARLRELETQRVASDRRGRTAVPSAESRPPSLAALRHSDSLRSPAALRLAPRSLSEDRSDETKGAQDPPVEAREPDEAPSPRGIRALLRRTWVPYAAAGLALVAGFGIGFAVFDREAVPSIALSGADAATQAELEESGAYDAGSIVPIAEEHGALIWRATQEEGARRCLIAASEVQTTNTCLTEAEYEQSGSVLSVSVELPDGGDEEYDYLNIALVRAIDGRLAVVAQPWSDGGWDWRSQYTEDELAVIDRLEAEGYDGETLQLVGYDGETPVWWEYRGDEECVIVSSPEGTEEACGEAGGGPVVLELPDPGGMVTGYAVTSSTVRGPVLTIYRGAGSVLFDVESGEIVEVDIDDRTGDPDR